MNDRVLYWRDDAPYLRALSERRRIVFTNGCFDMFHPGHLHLLVWSHQVAVGEGAMLVVGINSDKSVKGLKGESRPIWNERARANMVKHQVGVSEVVVFDEETPYEIIKQLSPAAVVKGGDYSESDVISLSSRVVIVPSIEGWSTTAVIEKIRGR